ncbi:3' exoribonuclease, putative [Plasmodium berghei]|uniref:3' exoribonuclease, putative n=1 Tax=Plasmodium berghei TaxID=5821 RepID=A0A1C6WP99_PLABE|nr:3' exoribonuclease, putative [Plasmodium berghei]SCM15363.1 3' exoribonuclease, putative [Plasmodium berghei]SCN22166.1 3' exoribonuclease, putative [Plasmodium berghei]
MSHYRAPLPHFNFKSKIEKCDEEFQKNGNFKRINNRKNNEIRDMFIKLGENGYSDASCFYSLGNTKILCLIYGPKPDSKNTTYNKGKVLLEIKNLNMEISEASDKSDEDIKNLLMECISNIIILEKYPQCSITIKCLIIQNDGGTNTNAGYDYIYNHSNKKNNILYIYSFILMNSIICPNTKRVFHLVDLDKLEEEYYRSKYEMNTITLGICLNLRTVCFFHGFGSFFNNKTLAEVIGYAEGACRSLGCEIKNTLKKFITKDKAGTSALSS